MIWPHGLLPREYANILDYGAVPIDPLYPPVDSTDAILRAIATGLQVLVPSGEYFVSEEIHFGNLAPGCTFLGEGRIRLNSAAARIRITGRHQVFDGMWITTGAFDFQPCVLVEGAEDLTFTGLRIACATDSTLLQLQDCSEIRLCGGHISGVNEYGYNTGILFCGVRGFGARGVSIDQLAAILYDPDSLNQLGLRISGAGLRIAASKIGFFDAKPVEQPTYTLAREYDQRNVGATTLEAVLGTLIQDLALLGLVKVSYT